MPIEPPETIYTDSTIVACDGGGGPLGHPKVYLNMGKNSRVECGYCDRLFILKDGHEPADVAQPGPKE